MYRLCRRSNLIPFILILAFGIAASILVPQPFPQTIGDMPLFALFPGEIAIALIFSVLLFENASPGDLIKIAGVMLGTSLGVGAIGNIVTQASVMMPEATLKVNWIQMIAFNLTGVISVIGYYTSTADEMLLYERRKENAVSKESLSQSTSQPIHHVEASHDPHADAASGESSKEILDGLDVERINQLEQSINRQPGKVSLESLFAEENQVVSQTENIATEQQSSLAAPVKSDLPINEFLPEQSASAFTGNLFEDVSKDIDNLFVDMQQPGSQKDFSPPEISAGAAIPDVEPQSDTKSKLQNAKSIAETAVKEFGRLSASASGNPNTDTSGTIKSIGNMLLDTAAVERIIKHAEKNHTSNSWQVLTVDNGKNLQALMEKLSSFEGIDSALIIGKDGMLISNTESLAALKYIYGPLSLAIHSTTNLGASKLQMGDMRQAILQSEDKLTILTDFGPGLLAVFGEWNLSSLDNILDFINTATAHLDSSAEAQTEGSADLSFDISVKESQNKEAAPKVEAVEKVELPKAELEHLIDAIHEPKGEAVDVHQSVEANSPQLGSLLDISEDDLTELIDGLLIDDSKEKVSAAASPEVKLQEDKTEDAANSILSVDDNELSGLFDNLLAVDSKEKASAEPEEEKPLEVKAEIKPEVKPEPIKVESASPVADKKSTPDASSILSVDDSELSGLFDNLLAVDSKEKTSAEPEEEKPLEVKAEIKPEVKPADKAKSALSPADKKPDIESSSVLNVDDNEISDLFDNLLATDSKEKAPTEEPLAGNGSSAREEKQPVEPVADIEGAKTETQASTPKCGSEIKEFGKLSASAALKPEDNQEQGTMKAIGRQLIDVQAVENIIKAGEKRSKIGGITTARVISAARGEGIQSLLQKIDTYDGVAGSLIVGHDGLIIASTLKSGIDKEMMGAMCNAIHSHLDVATQKLAMGRLNQALFKGGEEQLTVLTSVAVGILAVFVDNSQTGKINGLLEAIEVTIHG